MGSILHTAETGIFFIQDRQVILLQSVIICGMALDMTGEWHIGQVKPELQSIIVQNRKYFDGCTVLDLASFLKSPNTTS